jgi:hypothetical protein
MARKPYFKNVAVEHAAAKVYKDGFPIYMMVSKLKKELKRTEPFPDPVIMRFCDAYWKNKPGVQKEYPYFIKTFQMVSSDYYANQQQKEHADLKKQPVMAQSVKDVLKGMFG